MKKLIALIAVLGFVPYAHAADGADFSHSGEFRLQYTNDMNADLDDDAADSPDQTYHQRLRWGTTVRAGEKMTAHFTLVHNADWGTSGGTDQTPDTVPVNAAPGNAGTQNLLIVNEAYMTWMASDAWSLKMGRGSVTMADGRFVSANDFGPVAKAFDGALAMWDQEIAKFGFFGVRGADYGKLGSGGFNESGDFFGAMADFKSLPSFLKSAHLHVVEVKKDATAAVADNKEATMKIGTSLTGEAGGVDWRLNYEMEDGEKTADAGTKTDVSTSMIDAEIGYAMPDMMNSRVHFGYHTDSGTSSGTDDETYDGFHYDTHANAGLMDIIGWGNLTYMRLGGTMMPSDDITVGLEYLMFTQTEKEDAVYGTDGTALTAGDTTKDEIGNEIDLWVTKKYSNNFSATARYSLFQPGDEFGASPDDYSQLYLETKLTF